jgi:hypothetical protein
MASAVVLSGVGPNTRFPAASTTSYCVFLPWHAHLFNTLDLNRIQAETDTRNVASARILEKLGFVREGTLREDCVFNGDVSDS